MSKDQYESPLGQRYASREMKHIFSDDVKFSTWRKLWIALAEAERDLGIDIKQEQIDEMQAHIYDIDYEKAAEYESRLRHDVMAHVHTYGDCCPSAKGIIHLGATSCYVGDNAELIRMRDAMALIKRELINTIQALAEFAAEYKSLPTLAYTHFQAAQPTTLGKRACLWLQDLLSDLENLEFQMKKLKLLGCRGATGTCASFLELFEGDGNKAQAVEDIICRKMGFDGAYPVSGQTNSRKVDYDIVSVLSGICQSATKFSNDIRLMSHLKEVDEPFTEDQIGSSAMAYKRNPMRSERIASLARYVICDAMNPAFTAAGQWFERTLDDSANRRISVSEAFLATDGVLTLYTNILRGMRVYPAVIRKHLDAEMPFMVTENIMMYCVTHKGGDRQVLHEHVRQHSVAAGLNIKQNGADNDLFDRILGDPVFGLDRAELDKIIAEGRITGLAEKQTADFLREYVKPVLDANKELLGGDATVNV